VVRSVIANSRRLIHQRRGNPELFTQSGFWSGVSSGRVYP
jgi:hypothetical protein